MSAGPDRDRAACPPSLIRRAVRGHPLCAGLWGADGVSESGLGVHRGHRASKQTSQRPVGPVQVGAAPAALRVHPVPVLRAPFQVLLLERGPQPQKWNFLSRPHPMAAGLCSAPLPRGEGASLGLRHSLTFQDGEVDLRRREGRVRGGAGVAAAVAPRGGGLLALPGAVFLMLFFSPKGAKTSRWKP